MGAVPYHQIPHSKPCQAAPRNTNARPGGRATHRIMSVHGLVVARSRTGVHNHGETGAHPGWSTWVALPWAVDCWPHGTMWLPGRSTQRQPPWQMFLSTQQITRRNNETLLQLLSETCPYRGPQQEGGRLPMEMWTYFNRSAFHTWLYNYATGLITLQERGWPAPMSCPCRVYVNEAYRFIYVKARKVGGSSFLHAHNSTRFCTNIQGPVPMVNGRADCLRGATPSDYEQWMNYTVIGHTRNPWARAASSYTYINSTWAVRRGGEGWATGHGYGWGHLVVHGKHTEGSAYPVKGRTPAARTTPGQWVARQPSCMVTDPWCPLCHVCAAGDVLRGLFPLARPRPAPPPCPYVNQEWTTVSPPIVHGLDGNWCSS